MKTLAQTINEIKNANIASGEKKTQLFKLGLTHTDVNALLALWAAEDAEGRAPRRNYKYTFGIELEVYNVDRRNMMAAAAENGMNVRYEGYNHTDNTIYYKFVTDGSICGENAIECVSPILTEGRAADSSVRSACKALNEAGAKVNRSTGYHVHIGGPITDGQYVNVFKNYRALENVIDSFMAPSRRDSHWCATLADHNFDGCLNPNDVSRQLRGDRYHKVNAESWYRHHTIEFRQHAGTTNATKVLNWVKFCIKLVDFSKTNVITERIASIDEIPFLTTAEKRYFKTRKNEIEGVNA